MKPLLDREEKEVRKEIKRLERESSMLRQAPFSRNSDFMKSLPANEREDLLRAMESETSKLDIDEILDDDLDVDEVLEMQQDKRKPLTVTLRIPAKHKAYVRRFNTALKQAQKKGDEPEKRALWVWYLRCQQKVPGFSDFVSEDIWHYLWQSQTQINPRTRHVVVLARDMKAAGVNFEDDQVVDYLEALHMTGETRMALEIWESRKTTIDGARFDRIGVQLYAAMDRPSKAQEIAMAGSIAVDTVLPVFEAWTNSQKPNAAVRLWSFYLRLKQQVSSEQLTVDLLGQITSVLLKAGRREMALAVFKDMLASKQSTPAESLRLYQSLIGDEAPMEESINRIGLSALLSLPQTFNNKFFFGAWIKWLLGANQINDAALVIELMQERGIQPDARHLNGIIGAWFREGNDTSRERAEQMAWGMINARIQQVQRRGRSLSNSELNLLEAHAEDTKRLPRFLQRQVPAATIETFSVLLLRYTRQADLKRAEQLTEIMSGPAQIRPNSFILNHWLYTSLRASDVDSMWNRFKAVKDEIQPDLETFACLWDGERRNLNLPRRSRTFPTPRQLYREMTQWLNTISSTKTTRVESQFERELYEQIIRCFCLHSDIPCTFFVLRHMQERFGILPHEEIASMVVMQVARMMPSESAIAARPRRAARRRSDEIYRSALSNFASLMNEIYLRKISAAGMDVDLEDDAEATAAQAARLEAIQTFICLIMLKQAKQGSHVDNDLVVAARALGLEPDKMQIREKLDEALVMYEHDET